MADLVKGWFIGDFEPTLHRTNLFEVAVKRYRGGEREQRHLHKVAVEFTVVVSGEVEMNGERLCAGDIVRIDPGEAADFRVLSAEAVTTVVKIPCVAGDKYVIEDGTQCQA